MFKFISFRRPRNALKPDTDKANKRKENFIINQGKNIKEKTIKGKKVR